MSSSRWLAVFASRRARDRRRRLRQQRAAAPAADHRRSEKSPAKSPAPARPPSRRRRKPGSPNSRTPTPARRSPTTRSARAADANSSSPAALPSPAATRRSQKTKANSKRRQALQARRTDRGPGLHLADRDHLQPRSSKICSSPRKPLAKIFNQEITNWNDPAIAKDNPGVELPDTRIIPVNRSDESGTTQNFTDYLSEVAPSVWTTKSAATGRSKAARPHTAPPAWSKPSPPAKARSATPMPARPANSASRKIKVGNEFAEPTPEAAAKILEESPEAKEPRRAKHVFAFELDRKTESQGIYPIVLVSSLIACTEYELGQRSGHRQGLPRIRDQPRRPESRRRKRRLRSALRLADEEDQTGGRSDRSPQLD